MLYKNSNLYKEGDQPIDGVYLIKEGHVGYQIKHKVTRKIETKSKWVNPRILLNNQDKQTERKVIAQFSVNEIIGYEELFRQRIQDQFKQRYGHLQGKLGYKHQERELSK